ncbi:hypothetical protein N7532_009553 [Penicillium argentinense]|uniref:ARCA protein n=1 Tax=Penicillium argentinense TaxID=1131581 RepID=A0A9W9K2M7_9EURO|nr:uncharacterized protein N7532_009553 [Penicillium argentinense]KAJ5090869.1 hypothetical protein N7532_009553 [Penicillium argentinense]
MARLTKRCTGQLSYIHTTKGSTGETQDDEPNVAHENGNQRELELNRTQSISLASNSTHQSQPDLKVQMDKPARNFPDPASLSSLGRSPSMSRFASETLTVQSHRSESLTFFGSPFPPARNEYPIGPLKGLSDSATNASYASLEEACLIRHFTENLAYWFDTCDRDRHFELIVPQRAIFCPVLRYAILTASAGHLTRLVACRGNPGNDVVEVSGVRLPGLTMDTAVRYHDTCISYLLELSKDPNEQYNEDIITAATILRFYEQIDAPSIGIDSEAYLNTVQFIVHNQHNDSFYSYHTIQGPPRDYHIHSIPSTSLRHSAFLIALRQEIWSAFLNQRTFRLPVCPSNDYTVFDSASDFVWTNRILVWCADLLKFCFDESRSMPPAKRVERWTTLKSFDLMWEANRPLDFKPLYFEDTDPASGKFFPVIWHQNPCQVVGAQHVELSRILLAVSNPHLSRLGLAARSANLALEEELRCIIRRLIGLALSNPKCPVVFVDAAVGISVCGEYLTDPAEQNAVLEFLADLELNYAWPTTATSTALREAWQTRLLS